MGNILLEYMSRRVKLEERKIYREGPVITISRQFGCYANSIAEKLSAKLSGAGECEWNFVSKEILAKAADELNVRETEISHVFGANEKSFLGDLIVSFSNRKYKSDSLIKQTIIKVVRKYAEQGNCIVVGRAGCVIAKDIKKSLHVRIIAPFDHRVEAVKEHYKLSDREAEHLVIDTDKKRETFMSYFMGDRPDDELFDLILNKGKMSEDEIVAVIAESATQRSFLSYAETAE